MNNLKNISGVLALVISSTMLSCEVEAPVPNRAAPGDYFPLGEDHRWEYVSVHRYDKGYGAGKVITDTLKLQAKMLDGWADDFFALYDQHGWHYMWIRKDGTRYIERPAYAYEFMFLDSDMALNRSWTVYPYGAGNKIAYTVKAVNAAKIVNGIRYAHVIEILESQYGKRDGEDHFKLFSETRHYYAKDVGKLYSYQSYGTDGEGGTIEVTLIKHTRQ